MKNTLKLLGFLTLIAIVAFGCKKKPEPTPLPTVEDGYYVVGTSIFTDSLKTAGLMVDGYVDPGLGKDPVVRVGCFEKYIYATSAGDGFKVVQVVGDSTYTFGLDGAFTKTGDSLWTGSIKKDGAAFTVPADGFYFFMYDDSTMTAHMFKVEEWSEIGSLGWNAENDIPMTQTSISKESGSWEAKDVQLTTSSTFKLRFNHMFSYTIKTGSYPVYTNLGGSISNLVIGGKDNLTVPVNGYYTLTLNWNFKDGFTATAVKTSDYVPPLYPDSLFVTGDATAYGWATPGIVTNAAFHKCPSLDGVFWKVCFLSADKGFKVSAKNWTSPNLGYAEINLFDPNGMLVSNNGGNMSISDSGMVMIVVDLRNDSTKLSVTTANVYAMGDAFGGWTQAPANLFTIDNVARTMTSPAATSTNDMRIYAYHPWIPDWWKAEFKVDGGNVVYRNNGGDLPTVNITSGQTIKIHFDDNTGIVQ